MAFYQTLGMGLLFVGAVLFVNGIWLLGRGDNLDVAFLNFFTGIITFLIAIWWAFGSNEGTSFNAAGTLLFSFTYLWVGANAIRQLEDQRSLGWYCLFVALVAVPTGILVLPDIGLAFLWWAWSILWFGYWGTLGIEKTEFDNLVAWYTIGVGVATGGAGYIMLAGAWPWM